MDVRKKYKWAIDLVKAHFDKVIINEFDWGWGFAIGVENENGETRGLCLQRPIFEVIDGQRRFVDLYQLQYSPKTRQAIIDWLQGCFDKPGVATTKFSDREFDVGK